MPNNEKRVFASSVYRAREIGELYYRYKKDGITKKYVWETYIYPVYHISLRTLDRCLVRKVNSEIKRLEAVNDAPETE